MVLAVSGAVATSVLFATDAFFAFAGWRLLLARRTWGRECVRKLHAYTERRTPFFASIAILCTMLVAISSGFSHPRAGCLAGGASMALVAYGLVYARTACLVQQFKSAPVGSAEWHTRAGKLEAAMVTRASLQAAALICIVAAALVS